MCGDGLRVAMVHGPGRPDRDGVSDYVARLTRALVEVEVSVTPVPVRRDRRSGWTAATVRAARVLRRLRPDLVHVQFAPSAYRFSAAPGLLPALIPGDVPLVTTVHEYGWWAAPGWVPPPVWRPLERARWWDRETGRLVPASAAVVTTNSTHANELRRRIGAEPVQVPIAPNVEPLRAPPPRPEVRRRFGVPPDAPLLVFFGFVHPVKGLPYLIEALPALRARRPDLRLLVVGGFTSQALPAAQARAYRRQLRDHARHHGVAEAVDFTGHLPAADVSAVLAAADAAVLPFTHGVTTRSGALLATLAHGLPTAATIADDPDEALRDGETVTVIPARRDVEAVALTVDRLLDDAALRARLAAGGRRLVADRTWPRVAAAHRELYRRVLDGC